MAKLTLYKGITFIYSRVALDADGVPINLTGKGVEFVIKALPEDSDPGLLEASLGNGISIDDQTVNPGGYTVRIEPSVTDTLATGNRYFDVVIIDGISRYVDVERQRLQILYPVNHLGGSPPPLPIASSRFGHYVRKGSAGTIAIGVPVYPVGYSGGYVLVEPANGGVTPDAIGIISVACTNLVGGYAAAIGEISPINTTGGTVGAKVYLGNGAITLTAGTQELGAILAVGAQGAIAVHLDTAVSGAGGVIDGDKGDVIVSTNGTIWAIDPSVRIPVARNLIAGAGLIGGGDLSNDRSFAVGAHADGSIVVNADSVQVGVLATDAQHGLRGGGTQHALATQGSHGFMSSADKFKVDNLTAYWPIDQPRFYAVDPVNGNDNNLGYSDVSMSAAGAVALRTLEELYIRMPRQGANRIVMIGLGAGTHREKDGTTPAKLRRHGITGYEIITFRATQFLDTLADKYKLAGVTKIAGPDNGDGSWTVGSISGLTITVANGTLPTDRSANGWKIHFNGSANTPRGLQRVRAGGTSFDVSSSVVVSPGDRFWIEEPSVVIDDLEGTGDNSKATTGSLRGMAFAGIRFTMQSNPGGFIGASAGDSFAFCDFPNLVQFRSPEPVNFNGDYRDETGTLISLRHSFRTNYFGYLGATSSPICRFVFVIGAPGDDVVSKLHMSGDSPSFLAGSYIYGRCNITGGGLVSQDAGNSSEIGNVGSSFAPLAIDGLLNLRGIHVRLHGVDANNAAGNGVSIGGDAHVSIANLTGACSGYAVDVSTGLNAEVTFETGNTITGTTGGILLAGGQTATIAELATGHRTDSRGNVVQGSAGLVVTRRTQGTIFNVPLQAIDPAAAVSGDVWPLSDGRIGARFGSTNKWIWATVAQPVADYAQTTVQCRYFFIDPVNGLDTNIGYIDAANDATFSAGDRTGIPLKTWDEFVLRLPVIGAGRRITVLIAPLADGSVILDKSSVAQNLRLVGYGLYSRMTIRGSDLSNDLTDKTIGQAINTDIPAGDPNGDGSWTTTGAGLGYVDVAAAPPATAIGRRLRFITGALTATHTMIQNIVGTRLYLATQITPGTGDRFFIERSKVRFNRAEFSVLNTNDVPANGNATNSLWFAGIDFVSDIRIRQAGGGPIGYAFVSTAGNMVISDHPGTLTLNRTWNDYDAAGAAVSRTLGPNYIGAALSATRVASVQTSALAVHSLLLLTHVQNYLLQTATVLRGGGTIASCGGGGTGRSLISTTNYFGSTSATTPSQMIGGQLIIRESNFNVRNLRIQDCTSAPIKVDGKGSVIVMDGVVSPHAGNTDVILDMTTAEGCLVVSGREIANTAVGTLGAVRQNGTAIVSAFTAFNGRATTDPGQNKFVGSGAIDVELSTLRSSDPSSGSLVAGDRWLLNDNRAALRGTDNVTRYAWYGKAPPEANWPLTQTRYYFISHTNGSDTNVGYIDAAHGSTFTAVQGRAVALKTIEEFLQRVPRQGSGRRLVCLLEGDAAAVAPISYFDKDGTTLSVIDLSGISGYVTFLMRASDFTNNAADQLRCATYVKQAGPGAGGRWTVQSWSAPDITVTSATLSTTFGTLEGCCLEFDGNTTAALATKGGIVKHAESSSVLNVGIGSSTTQTAPAAGDTFLITAPSVKTGPVQGSQGNLSIGATVTGNTSRFPGNQFAGIQFANPGTYTNSAVLRFMDDLSSFSKCTFTGFTTIRFSSGNGFGFLGGYFNEVGAYVETGHSATFGDGVASLGLGFTGTGNVVPTAASSTLANVVALATNAANAFISLDGLFGSSGQLNSSILSRSALHGSLVTYGVRLSGPVSDQASLGGANGAYDQLLIRCRASSADGIVLAGGNSFRLANVAIGGSGDAVANAGLNNSVEFVNVVNADNANTGYGLNCVDNVRATHGRFVDGGGNTVSGATGEILLQSGSTFTWAGLTQGVQGVAQNVLTKRSQTVGAFQKLTIGTLMNSPPLAADPVSPADGDVWVTDIAGVRSACFRIAGATYRATLT